MAITCSCGAALPARFRLGRDQGSRSSDTGDRPSCDAGYLRLGLEPRNRAAHATASRSHPASCSAGLDQANARSTRARPARPSTGRAPGPRAAIRRHPTPALHPTRRRADRLARHERLARAARIPDHHGAPARRGLDEHVAPALDLQPPSGCGTAWRTRRRRGSSAAGRSRTPGPRTRRNRQAHPRPGAPGVPGRGRRPRSATRHRGAAADLGHRADQHVLSLARRAGSRRRRAVGPRRRALR